MRSKSQLSHFQKKCALFLLAFLFFTFSFQAIDSFSKPVQAQSAGSTSETEQALFFENFEDKQVNGWNFNATEWKIVSDPATNSFVWTSTGEQSAYASIGTSAWGDYLFSIDVCRNEGNVNLYFRVNQDQGYALRLENMRVVLWTERSGTQKELASNAFSVGTNWHHYAIEAKGKEISVSIDESQVIHFVDDAAASLSGGIALELTSKEQAYFDNIRVLEEGESGWEQTGGPNGGVINSIEIDPQDPDRLFIGGVGGIYFSEDAGASWAASSGLGSDAGMVYDLLLDPTAPKTLYARTDQLYRSNDLGKTWKKLFSEKTITCAAMNRNHPEQLLIGDESGQVWLSKDHGDNWQNISGNLPGVVIKALAFGKDNEFWVGSKIVDGVGSGALYRTADGGKSWAAVDLGQKDSSDIQSIFVNPQDPNQVYVGLHNIYNEMFNPANDPYLVKSVNGGQNWKILRLPQTDAMVNVIGFTAENALYAATGGYLFASHDQGSTWADISPQGRNGDMYDLAVNPNNAQELYLPRRAYGMVKSENGGKDWTPINKGLLNTSISLLALGDEKGSTIYASSVGGEGTYKSTDYGETWENITAGGITHPWADELSVSPIDPQTIWEVADVGNLYISNDAGTSWKKAMDSTGSGFRAGTITASAVAAANKNIVYALRSGFGIYKSTDAGKSWDFLHSSEVDYSYSLAVNPDNADIVFSGDTPKLFQNQARVQRSLDGGETWSTVLTVPNSKGITSVALDPQKPESVYAGSTGNAGDGGGQVYHSTNNGKTWDSLNKHFTMLTVWGQPQLVGDPNDPATVYAATWLAGTWKTADSGKSWTKLAEAPISSTSLSIDAENSHILYAADRTAPKLWKSTDSGNTWAVTADFSKDGAFLLNRVYTDKDHVYASTFGPSIHSGKLYCSTDEGKTWKDITNGLPRSVLDIAVDPSNENRIFVTTHIYGAYQTEDGGKTWSQMMNFPDIGSYDIEIDPSSPNILYAAGLGGSIPDWVLHGGYTFKDSAGVYKSVDGGKTWKQILETSNECRAIRISATDHNLLFASALTDGFFVSKDGGKTWANYNSGLDSTNLTSLWVNGDKVYAGTQGFGVYSGDLNTSSGAVKWVAARSNKPVPDVYNIKVQVDPSDGQNIYVSANPGGLYRSDDGGRTWYDKNFLTPSVLVDDPVRQGYYLFAINPANPDEVWVGTWGKGIYKSYDGQNFNIGANGNDQSMYSKHVNALLFSSKLGVVAATEEGVFYTRDNGETWLDWNTGLGTTQIRTLDQFKDGTILAGTAGYEFYQRRPDDDAWQQVNALGNYGTFWPIWNNRPLYQYSQLLFDQTDANTVYFGTFPEGIFKSTDGGAAWLEKNVGWAIDGVFTLVFSPADKNMVYAGTYNGISRSSDNGEHWEVWNAGWPEQQWVFSIAFDPDDPQIMYACSKNGENEGLGRDHFHGTVMKSTDGGANWKEITQGLDKDNEFYKIIADKFDADTLYLATQYDGVMVSHDAGEHWQAFNEGLTTLQAGTNGNNVTNTMALSDDGKVLYFGTAGSGVFRRYLPIPSGD